MNAVAGRRVLTAAPGKLPRHLTSFVGRDVDLRALKVLVRTSRLVTLTGTGGAGKSRLAAEVARDSGDAWPDGAWWVELAAETDVGGAVVANLELPGRGSPPQVAASWLARRRALLILDNCEHLVDQCAKFCQVLLELCPEVSVLATSREPLGVAGEVRWPVASLVTKGRQATPTTSSRKPGWWNLLSSWRPRIAHRFPRYVSESTGCRLRSRWRPRGSISCQRRSCWRTSTTGGACWRAVRARRRSDSRR